MWFRIQERSIRQGIAYTAERPAARVDTRLSCLDIGNVLRCLALTGQYIRLIDWDFVMATVSSGIKE